MLRHPPSKVSLSMAEVDQLKHRLKRRHNSHPNVAQSDWFAIHASRATPNTKPHPLPHIPLCLRRGPRRSHDDIVIQINRDCPTPQSASIEGASSSEDNESFEFQPPDSDSARLVQMVEVHPTITQVTGYDPPAALITSPEQSPTRANPYFAGDGRPRMPQQVLALEYPRRTGNETLDNIGDSVIPRPSHVPFRRGGWTSSSIEGSEISNSSFGFGQAEEPRSSSSILDPHALAFVPRVRFGSVTESAYRQSSCSSDGHSDSERLRLKSASSRNSDPRGDISHPPRSIPRRSVPTHGRQQNRGAHLLSTATSIRPHSGHMGPPVVGQQLTMVQDRYPVFSTSFQVPFDPPRRNHEALSRREAIFRERQSERLYQQPPGVSPHTGTFPRMRPRPSSSSLSTPNLTLPSGGPPVHARQSSLTWNRQESLNKSPGSAIAAGSSSMSSTYQHGETSENAVNLLRQLSPLDRLQYELRRASALLPALTDSMSTSHTTSTYGGLLSGSPFYSDNSDDDLGEDHDAPLPKVHLLVDDEHRASVRETMHDSHESKGYTSVHVPLQDKSDVGFESKPEQKTRELPPFSPLNQACRVPLNPPNSAVSLLTSTSSPPDVLGDLISQAPVTPRRQSAANPRKTIALSSHNRVSATPRVKVYDDELPASIQPQTPADLIHKSEREHHPHSPIGSPCRSTPHSAEMSRPGYSPLIPPRNTHRNTYPSSNQSYPMTYERYLQHTNLDSPGIPLRNAAAASAVARRRAARTTSDEQENEFDPEAVGMAVEREVWSSRRNGVSTTLDVTPPREGRFERYLNES